MIAMWSKLNFRSEHVATLPGALLLIVAGSILVHREGFDYSATWVVSAYVLWVIAVILGAGVLGRHAHRIHHLASAEVKQGLTVSSDAMKLARSPVGPVVDETNCAPNRTVISASRPFISAWTTRASVNPTKT